MAARARIDKLLVERGLFDSRARAQAAVLAGQVTANGERVRKPSQEVELTAELVARDVHPFVSRGGLKLVAGLDAFGFDPMAKRALDVGASTGGFTDVLLSRGVGHVVAVDVGHDQFHARLRGRPDVDLWEGTDIRRLTWTQVGAPVDLIVIDVSFISLALVLLPALAFAADAAALVALVKPQFEAGPALVRKGLVRDPSVHAAVCVKVEAQVSALGWQVQGLIPSPIAGGDGNLEFLLGAVRS